MLSDVTNGTQIEFAEYTHRPKENIDAANCESAWPRRFRPDIPAVKQMKSNKKMKRKIKRRQNACPFPSEAHENDESMVITDRLRFFLLPVC